MRTLLLLALGAALAPAGADVLVGPAPGLFGGGWAPAPLLGPGIAGPDDLDALVEPLFDCNGNGIEDAIDIGAGTSADTNLNGVPDECESAGKPSCPCASGTPCGNVDPVATSYRSGTRTFTGTEPAGPLPRPGEGPTATPRSWPNGLERSLVNDPG